MSIPEFTPHYSRHSADVTIKYILKENSIAEIKRMLALPRKQLLKAKFFLSKRFDALHWEDRQRLLSMRIPTNARAEYMYTREVIRAGKARIRSLRGTRKLMGVLFGTLELHERPKVPLPPMPYYHLIQDLIYKA